MKPSFIVGNYDIDFITINVLKILVFNSSRRRVVI